MIKKPISINSARQYVYSKLASFYKRNNAPINWEKGDPPPQLKEKVKNFQKAYKDFKIEDIEK